MFDMLVMQDSSRLVVECFAVLTYVSIYVITIFTVLYDISADAVREDEPVGPLYSPEQLGGGICLGKQHNQSQQRPRPLLGPLFLGRFGHHMRRSRSTGLRGIYPYRSASVNLIR